MVFDIRFLPEEKTVSLDEPTALSDAAALADVLIDHPCGSNATCGKCRVRFRLGAPEPTPADLRLFSAEEIADGWRLACQAVVASQATVEIPALSRVASAKSFGPEQLYQAGTDPFVRLHTLTLPAPTLEEQWATEDALGRQMGNGFRPRLSFLQLRQLHALIRQGRGVLSAVFDEDRLLHAWANHDDPGAVLGLALDLGSTSLAGALVELSSGKVLANDSMLNPQVRYGADVISRIDFAQSRPEGNSHLHEALVGAINELLGRLLEQAGCNPGQVWTACAAGNPAMLHTLLGVDVTPLGQSPYVGMWTRALSVEARQLGIHLPENARLRVFPMIRSNVGGDTVAAVVAAGVDQGDELTLLIDLGTNCEVVLGNRHRLIATSTAAGPAFEGANIRHGMRAAPGAIDRVSLRPNGHLAVRVLGGVKARGICGSGVVDAVSALLRAGVIDPSGRMLTREALEADPSAAALCERIVADERGLPAVMLSPAELSEAGNPVMLHAMDVRQLQLIKGSILAGAKLLLERWGAELDQLERVLITGAFGSFLRKTSAMDIGLVPPVAPERISFIGNAAGVGARMALVERDIWRRAEEVRERAEYLELGSHPDYQDAFAEAMGFYDSPVFE